jgi:hypothetical protein
VRPTIGTTFKCGRGNKTIADCVGGRQKTEDRGQMKVSVVRRESKVECGRGNRLISDFVGRRQRTEDEGVRLWIDLDLK